MLTVNINENVVLFDDDDSWVLRYSLSVIDNGKGHKRVVFTSGELEYKYVHRVIISTRKGQIVDHINRNPLDNRKCNLRHVSKYINAANASLHRDKADQSLPIGVTKTKHGKYKARISITGTRLELGVFDTPIEAAEAYRRYAVIFNTGWHDGTKG